MGHPSGLSPRLILWNQPHLSHLTLHHHFCHLPPCCVKREAYGGSSSDSIRHAHPPSPFAPAGVSCPMDFACACCGGRKSPHTFSPQAGIDLTTHLHRGAGIDSLVMAELWFDSVRRKSHPHARPLCSPSLSMISLISRYSWPQQHQTILRLDKAVVVGGITILFPKFPLSDPRAVGWGRFIILGVWLQALTCHVTICRHGKQMVVMGICLGHGIPGTPNRRSPCC